MAQKSIFSLNEYLNGWTHSFKVDTPSSILFWDLSPTWCSHSIVISCLLSISLLQDVKLHSLQQSVILTWFWILVENLISPSISEITTTPFQSTEITFKVEWFYCCYSASIIYAQNNVTCLISLRLQVLETNFLKIPLYPCPSDILGMHI